MIKINRDPSLRDLRQFAGIWFPAFWAGVGLLIYRATGALDIPLGIWGVAAGLSLAGLLRPPLLRPIYVGMVLAVFPIGWVVSHLLLAVIYYSILTPVALFLRLRGRDPLRRAFDQATRTYWYRRPDKTDLERYFKQY